jgi:hypothetical protein
MTGSPAFSFSIRTDMKSVLIGAAVAIGGALLAAAGPFLLHLASVVQDPSFAANLGQFGPVLVVACMSVINGLQEFFRAGKFGPKELAAFGRGLVIAAAGAVLTYLQDAMTGGLAGQSNPLNVVAWTVFINALRKYVRPTGDYVVVPNNPPTN